MPDSKTPLVRADHLSHALSIPAYKHRRIALRNLVQPVLEHMFTLDQVRSMLLASPLVGTGEKQIVVRPQISGLRDQFDEATLIAVAYSGTNLEPVVEEHFSTEMGQLLLRIDSAIRLPSSHGYGSSSRTGYAFGRPRYLGASALRTMTARVSAVSPVAPATLAPASPPAPAVTPSTHASTHDADHASKEVPLKLSTFVLPERTSLEHLIRMVDHVAVQGSIPVDEATAALQRIMAKAEDAERFEAAREMIEMRSPTLAPTCKADLPTLPHALALIVVSALVDVSPILAGGTDSTLACASVGTDALASTIHASTHTSTSTSKESASMSTTVSSSSVLPTVDPTIASMIDAMLSSAKLPPLTSLMASIRERDERLDVQGKRLKALMDEQKALEAKLAEAAALPAASMAVTASHDGTIPAGEVTWVPAHEAFGLSKGKEAFSFNVPVWKWDGVHPHVPVVDKHYVFRPFELMRVLYGLVANKRIYLHGHTGTGKTTLIEQVAARLNYPFMRLNFDSEISRMDLIGRDTLTSEGGTTVSRFVDGILPQMMQSPCIGCFDEIDFVRPDIAYVMQRMLEGDALVLTEDGGRVVKPHPMFRAFATGNTVGQGDEYGMYQGARVQSTALLDRFSIWQKIDYLKPEDRNALIRAKAPKLSDELRSKLNSYITEHLQAFTTSKVLQPLSPRGFLGLADALVFFTSVIPDRREAVRQAVESTILDRASVQDRVVLKGLADRVFG